MASMRIDLTAVTLMSSNISVVLRGRAVSYTHLTLPTNRGTVANSVAYGPEDVEHG